MKKEIQIGSAEYIYKLNKKTILNLIRQEGVISRADIVKQTGISASTVTRIADSLINKEKLAIQIGTGVSTGGRRPILVKFNGKDSYVIGVDWGRTHIYVVLANLDGEHIFEMNVPCEPDNNFNKDLAKTCKIIETVIVRSRVDINKLLGIGVAAAGLLNKTNDIIKFSPNFNWRDVDIKTPLEDKFKVPVVIDNVSRVMALGEYYYGDGQKYRDFIYINIGYGIGAGIIHNAEPFFGSSGITGEIGHNTVIPESNIKCVCGRNGCLETISSGRGISETAKREIVNNKSSILNEICENDIDSINAEMVAQGAKLGDQLCIEILNKSAYYLGLSISKIVNFMNPQVVYIGGGVSLAGANYIDTLVKSIKKYTLPDIYENVKVKTSTHKENAAVVGALSLILTKVMNFEV